MMPAAFPVTFFTDKSATLLREERLAADDLAQRIREMVKSEKDGLPLLKLGQFGTLRSEKNSLRHNANVLRICGVEGDYDGEEIGFDAACRTAREAGLRCLIYTSPSHTPDKPRWRVLAPTSELLLPGERDKLMGRLNGLYGGVFGGESFTLSQSYYYGRVVGAPDHRVEVIGGDTIDMLDELDAIAIYRRPEANGHAEDYEPKAADDLRASDIADVFAALAVIPNESEAEWNGWKAIALAVHAAAGGGETGSLAFDYWSKKNSAYNAAETRKCWAEVSQRPGNRSGMGKLVHLAREAVSGWRKPSDTAKDWTVPPRNDDPYTAYGARYGNHGGQQAEEDWASYARVSTFYSAATLRGRAVPPREWLVADLVPMKTVTLFSGDGGTGKSLLALQLAVAVAAGVSWLGRAVNQGRAIVLSAEDDNDELHRRLDGILRATGLQYDDIAGLTLRSVAGEDALLAVEDKVALTQTALFRELETRAADDHASLIAIDTLADVYPANENDRAKVRQFIGILRGLALRHRCAVMLLAHPSLTGLNSGTGTSGSTGWNNSVRSRLYLERIVEKGEGNQYEPDPDKRVLTTKKSNYSRIGSEIVMTWKDGVFVADQVEGESLLDLMSATMKAERVFLGLLREMNKQGRRVNAVSSSSYAPKVFAGHPKSEGCTKTVLKNAMERLFSGEKIVIKHEGPPSRRVSYLAVAEASDG